MYRAGGPPLRIGGPARRGRIRSTRCAIHHNGRQSHPEGGPFLGKGDRLVPAASSTLSVRKAARNSEAPSGHERRRTDAREVTEARASRRLQAPSTIWLQSSNLVAYLRLLYLITSSYVRRVTTWSLPSSACSLYSSVYRT